MTIISAPMDVTGVLVLLAVAYHTRAGMTQADGSVGYDRSQHVVRVGTMLLECSIRVNDLRAI